MRTTLNIDDELLEQALKLTNITSKSELIRRAPKALVEKESAWRLAKMGGSQPGLKPITRRCLPMIPTDASVWVEYSRGREKTLEQLLKTNRVFIHPFVIGEVACGNVANREGVFSVLKSLPALPVISDYEVLRFIERNRTAKSTGRIIEFPRRKPTRTS